VDAINVRVHSSQFPDAVRRDLLESLRSRSFQQKFHYESVKQAQKWLALHEAYSPARRDQDCLATYQTAFSTLGVRIAGPVHCVGLATGGGQKEAALLQALDRPGLEFTACEVSVPLAIISTQATQKSGGHLVKDPIVCDLFHTPAQELRSLVDESASKKRLFSCFGLIPNSPQSTLLEFWRNLLRPDDFLVFSANLAPGPDYGAGVTAVLALYDNQLTKDWLLTALLDLGLERDSGTLSLEIRSAEGLKKITGIYRFMRDQTLWIAGAEILFRAEEELELFFSFRHQSSLLVPMLRHHGLDLLEQWISPPQDEGVFLCRRLE
jgi:L-histidine N-alpha-methyltransferase